MPSQTSFRWWSSFISRALASRVLELSCACPQLPDKDKWARQSLAGLKRIIGLCPSDRGDRIGRAVPEEFTWAR